MLGATQVTAIALDGLSFPQLYWSTVINNRRINEKIRPVYPSTGRVSPISGSLLKVTCDFFNDSGAANHTMIKIALARSDDCLTPIRDVPCVPVTSRSSC